MSHKECRYCDGGFYAKQFGDELVCANCGAEWNPIVVIDDDETERRDMMRAYRQLGDEK